MGRGDSSSGRPNQSYRAAIDGRRRRANALRWEHRRRPFTHVVELLPVAAIAEGRFRDRLADFAESRFFSVWQREISAIRSKGGVPHYHALVRTTEETKAVVRYIEDALSHRRGTPPRMSYLLNVRPLEPDPEEVERAILYACKATRRLLRKIAPQRKGERTIFAVGGPFDKGELAAAYWRDHQRLLLFDFLPHSWAGEWCQGGTFIPATEPEGLRQELPAWFVEYLRVRQLDRWRTPAPHPGDPAIDAALDAFLARCLAGLPGGLPGSTFGPDDPMSPPI